MSDDEYQGSASQAAADFLVNPLEGVWLYSHTDEKLLSAWLWMLTDVTFSFGFSMLRRRHAAG